MLRSASVRPVIAAPIGQPAAQTVVTPNFRITFDVPVAQGEVERTKTRLEEALRNVRKFIPFPAGKRLGAPPFSVRIAADVPVANAFGGKLELPLYDGRVYDQPMEHELTHLLLRYGAGGRSPGGSPRPLLDEGLASFVGETFNRGPIDFPHLGQSADAWSRYFIDHGHEGLKTMLDTPLKELWRDKFILWKAYGQASSFMRWYAGTHGWDELWKLYDGKARQERRLDEDIGRWRDTLRGREIEVIAPRKALEPFEWAHSWIGRLEKAPALNWPSSFSGLDNGRQPGAFARGNLIAP